MIGFCKQSEFGVCGCSGQWCSAASGDVVLAGLPGSFLHWKSLPHLFAHLLYHSITVLTELTKSATRAWFLLYCWLMAMIIRCLNLHLLMHYLTCIFIILYDIINASVIQYYYYIIILYIIILYLLYLLSCLAISLFAGWKYVFFLEFSQEFPMSWKLSRRVNEHFLLVKECLQNTRSCCL